jgi:Protein of unknown function (DUF3761)
MRSLLLAAVAVIALAGAANASCLQPDETELATHHCYTNGYGDPTHSPSYDAYGPCADGTYSFSQHRSGTCSHHGGVL